jgi:hypothetical protein
VSLLHLHFIHKKIDAKVTYTRTTGVLQVAGNIPTFDTLPHSVSSKAHLCFLVPGQGEEQPSNGERTLIQYSKPSVDALGKIFELKFRAGPLGTDFPGSVASVKQVMGVSIVTNG